MRLKKQAKFATNLTRAYATRQQSPREFPQLQELFQSDISTTAAGGRERLLG